MSSDEDFAGYKEYEDQLYQEESSSGSDDDLDSEVEEALYSQVHYASSLLVSESSTPGDQRAPKKKNSDDGLNAQELQKSHKDNSFIEISSDDDGVNSIDDTDVDSVEDVEVCSSLQEYPEVINLFSAENDPSSVRKTTEIPNVQKKEEPGKIIENWDLNQRDLGGSTVTRQRSRYYTPGKGLPNVRCYNCNEKGHLSQYCPEPKKTSVCFLCGGLGHIKRNCPNELCFNCHEPGHISKQCRKPRVRPFDRCKRCHVLGHLAYDCPDRWRQYHLTTEPGPVVCPDRPASPPRSVFCYNCGHQGHYGHECPEENSLRRGELPLPFVVNYDGCQMSSSREKKNNDKWKSARGPRNERQNQRAQDTQQDYDMDSRSFEPPAEKVQMMNDGNGIRRVSFDEDSYQTSECNAQYTDHVLPRRKNKKKNKNKDREDTGSTERIVEFLDPGPPVEGLMEEPYQTKKKKTKKRKQWQDDRFDDNSYNNNSFVPRKKFKQHNNRGFTNPHRNKNFRSNEEREFDARRTSSNLKKGRKDFVSNRGFRFNNQTRGKKSNSQFVKHYTF